MYLRAWVTVCPGVQTTMPDNRDRPRGSLKSWTGYSRDHGDNRVADFRVEPHSVSAPALVCAVRPANMWVKNEEQVSSPKREYRENGCNDGAISPHLERHQG